jgi:hypothetical protein
VLINASYDASSGNTNWVAVVLSYKDGSVYDCTAARTPASNHHITLNCNKVPSFPGAILPGPNVVNVPMHYDVGQSSVITDFWQLHQQSGELQFCTPVSFCARMCEPKSVQEKVDCADRSGLSFSVDKCAFKASLMNRCIPVAETDCCPATQC